VGACLRVAMACWQSQAKTQKGEQMTKRKVSNDDLLEAAAALLANDEDYDPVGALADLMANAPTDRADAVLQDDRADYTNIIVETASDEPEAESLEDPGEFGVSGFRDGKPVFITPDGVVLELKQLNTLVLMHVFSPNRGKPKPPKIKVRLAGGHERYEDHAEDEAYLERVAEWQTGHSLQGLMFLFNYGILNMPPPEFHDQIADLYDEGLSTKDVKFLWVAGLAEKPQTQEALIEAIMGLSVPTEEGLDEAENFTESPSTGGPS